MQTGRLTYDRSWLPRPLIILWSLPPERRLCYMRRQLDRQRQDGWLLVARPTTDFDGWVVGALDSLGDLSKIDENEKWTLFHFVPNLAESQPSRGR